MILPNHVSAPKTVFELVMQNFSHTVMCKVGRLHLHLHYFATGRDEGRNIEHIQ